MQDNVNTLQLQNDLHQQVNIQNALLLHLQQNQQGPPQHQEVVNKLRKIGVAVADAVRALVLVVWIVSAWIRTLQAAPTKMDAG